MTDVSVADLEKIREENQKLRDKIEAAKSTKAEREAGVARELEYTQLQAENARLSAELAMTTEAAKVGSVKEGSAGLVELAKDQLKAAQAQADRPVGPVDTNAENPPKGTTGEVDGTKTNTDEIKDGGSN